MAPAASRQAFVETLRKVASANGLEFLALSSDWIVQFSDANSGSRCSVIGYTFDLNPAAATEICKEKAATSLVLGAQGVPNIPHHVFLNPANEFTANYVPKAGIWSGVQKLCEELGFPVVLKPLKGTGGLDVMKATCWREVEAAVQHIFSRDYGVAVSPYKKIVDEYRCVILDGKVEMSYRKVRPHVLGDGSANVATLIAQQLSSTEPAKLSSWAAAVASLSVGDLGRVPAEGEAFPVQWKHNLGTGATLSFDLRPDAAATLQEIAPRAANAIGVRFCSVDVVEVEGEGFMVMEVNGGVMMDSLIKQLGDPGAELAYRLYESAVLRALGRQ